MDTLTSKLFATTQNLDFELDGIFRSSAVASSSRKVQPPKHAEKKSQAVTPTAAFDTDHLNSGTSRRDRFSARPAKRDVATTRGGRPVKRQKLDRQERKRESSDEEEEDEAEQLQQSKKAKNLTAGTPGKSKDLPEDLTHISLDPSRDNQKAVRKVKYTPPDETRGEVDARTVFVGNLPPAMLKEKSGTKALVRHLTSSLPATAKWKVESTRFRSVAFNSSSAVYNTQDDPAKPGEGEDAAPEDGTTFLTPSQKKRLAFIKGETHDKATVTNCYVVFGHIPPSEPADPDVLPPSEVAKLVVQDSNASTFRERTIRVDRVGSAQLKTKSESSSSRKEDMKKTVFVGSLSFEATEEDVRAFFESLIEEQRGPSREEENGVVAQSDAGSKQDWVQHVRIIRDQDTQLGKGIAYVQFKDVECVDEILALSPESLTFRRRMLRVQRCKTSPGSKQPAKTSSISATLAPKEKRSKTGQTASPPKGDPTLGSRLTGLSKSERKEAKSSEADRVARRLAKKKMRAAMGERARPGKGGVLGKMPKSKGKTSGSSAPGKKARAKKA